MASGKKLTIAIEGCCHGELDKIYATLQYLQQKEGRKVDLLISCGDFQAVRNMDDLETMACPPKYRHIQTFYKYYSGEKVAPIPTLFIGGNHEASNHLWELYYGGWAAPNMRFLGFAGCIKFGGYRIAGLSGIYKQGDYARGHHERLPYTDSTMRSIYHIRDFEVYRLMQLKQPVDLFVSHDWPRNIARWGDMAGLLSRKPFLREEVESGELGSPPGEALMKTLKPSYWFSAHMHTKFAAIVPHPPRSPPAGGTSTAAGGTGGPAVPSETAAAATPQTRFLALDKCLPGRDFLQVVELDVRCEGPPVFEYDEEWLAVMRATHGTVNLSHQHRPLPGMGALRRGASPEDFEFVRALLATHPEGARIPNDFVPTVTPYSPATSTRGRMPSCHVRNPQTVALLDMLQLPYNLDHSQPPPPAGGASRTPVRAAGPVPPAAGGSATKLAANPEEIDLGDDDDDVAEDVGAAAGAGGTLGDSAGDVAVEEDDDAVDDGDEAGTGGTPVQPEVDVDRTLQDDPMFQPVGL